MKKIFAVIGVTLALAVGAAAQDTPRMEVFLGYSYVRFMPSHGFPNFNANGGSGQFAYNFSKNFSAVLDLGGVHNGSNGPLDADTTVANFLAGPRYGIRHGRWRPYVQTLFGGVYGTTSWRINVIPVATDAFGNTIIVDPNQVVTTRLAVSNVGFALTAGGGLDIKANKHLSIRPIQAEYFLTRLDDPITRDRSE